MAANLIINIPNFSSTATMTVYLPGERADEHAFLDSVEGEISFFRSIMRARPVGMHRHFHIIAIRNFISKDTGRLVHIDAIWEKLRKCYDLDALDAVVRYRSFSFLNGILQTNERVGLHTGR